MDISTINTETIIQGLTYEKELTLLAKRFEESEQETLKKIVHAVYTSGFNSYEFLEKLFGEVGRVSYFWSYVNGKLVEDEDEIEEDFIPAF